MELISEFLASPADAGALILELPTVPARPCVFVPLLRREGGVLASLPVGSLDRALLEAGAGGGPDVGGSVLPFDRGGRRRCPGTNGRGCE